MKTTFTVRTEEETKEGIKSLAKKKKQTFSKEVNEALKKHLKDEATR